MRKIKFFISLIMVASIVFGKTVIVKANSNIAVLHHHVCNIPYFVGIDYENTYTHDVPVHDFGNEAHTSDECIVMEEHEIYKYKCACGFVDYNGNRRIMVVLEHSICESERYWLN